MSKYSDFLKDPRWQRKRLEILQRDNFTCQMCGKKDQELHVHHKRYLNGRKPWDHEDDLLVTVCKEDHAAITALKDRIGSKLSDHDSWFWGSVCDFMDKPKEERSRFAVAVSILAEEPWLIDHILSASAALQERSDYNFLWGAQRALDAPERMKEFIESKRKLTDQND